VKIHENTPKDAQRLENSIATTFVVITHRNQKLSPKYHFFQLFLLFLVRKIFYPNKTEKKLFFGVSF